MRLADVLALDVVKRAKPEVVTGDHLLDRELRWVHTSELAEAASLLKGGELLLTTGLGLAGRGAVGQESYVAELAARGVVALALELGWTFPVTPPPMAEAARARDLPLIALHEVVPFVEITEVIQTLLLEARFARLRLARDVDDVLEPELQRGHGPQALAAALAEMLHCATVLETRAGHVVAYGGPRAHTSALAALARGSVTNVEIELLGQTWGCLHFVDVPTAYAPLLAAAKERAPFAIALALQRDRGSLSLRSRLCQDFLAELIDGRFVSLADLRGQASVIDFTVPPDGAFVAFAAGEYPAEDGSVALRAAETSLGGDGVVAEVDGIILGLLDATRVGDTQVFAESLLHSISETMVQRGSHGRPRVAVGPVVMGLDASGVTLREARATLLLAGGLELETRAVTARGLAADRLLGQLIDEPLMASVISDQIGPLLRHDSEHAGSLVETLWAHLTSRSATEAARILYVRRQSLYKRLEKIKDLIGSVDDPQRRLSLLMALRAHQLLCRRRPGRPLKMARVAGATRLSPPDPREGWRPVVRPP